MALITPPNFDKNKDSNSPSTAKVSSPTLLTYDLQPYQPKPNEVYMGDEQRRHFRKLLTLWKSDLLQGGDEAILDLQETGEMLPDLSDQATREEDRAVKLRKRDRERKLIQKIDSAIQRIDNKEYGLCEECGIEIGIRRLEARPTADLCIDCKTLDEVREKQGR